MSRRLATFPVWFSLAAMRPRYQRPACPISWLCQYQAATPPTRTTSRIAGRNRFMAETWPPRRVGVKRRRPCGSLGRTKRSDRFRTVTLGMRHALVTGSGSGIGRAVAHRLGRDGAAVTVLDIDLAAARCVAEELSAAGVTAGAVAADVADAEAVRAATTEARGARGDVHV